MISLSISRANAFALVVFHLVLIVIHSLARTIWSLRTSSLLAHSQYHFFSLIASCSFRCLPLSSVSSQYLEIYQEVLIDLLVPRKNRASTESSSVLKIREDPKRGACVHMVLVCAVYLRRWRGSHGVRAMYGIMCDHTLCDWCLNPWLQGLNALLSLSHSNPHSLHLPLLPASHSSECGLL